MARPSLNPIANAQDSALKDPTQLGPGDGTPAVAVTLFEGIRVTPDKTFENCPQLDVLFVPGGSDPVSVLTVGHPGSIPYLDFMIRQAKGAQLVCSVCTGALLLAGTGLLNGDLVTTHWAFKDVLRLFPVRIVDDFRRYVQVASELRARGIRRAWMSLSILCRCCMASTRRGAANWQYNTTRILHSTAVTRLTPKSRMMRRRWRNAWRNGTYPMRRKRCSAGYMNPK